MTDPNPGTVHTMEEAMRSAGQGVFEAKSNAAPANKARKAAPENKELPALSGMTKAELEKQAKREGVDLSDAANNDERRAAIEAARK